MTNDIKSDRDYSMMLAASGSYSVDTFGICAEAPRAKPHLLAKHARRLENGY